MIDGRQSRRHESVAAIYDIHGNLPALDAVLAAVGRDDIETVVIGGDIVLGPMPRESLARIRSLGDRALIVRGNCDRLVAAPDDPGIERLPAAVRETISWAAAQLTAADRELLGGLPTAVTVHVTGLGDVLFCHATARSDDELFTVRSPDDVVRPMFAGVDARIVVCGHTHMQFDRQLDSMRIVNAGSVGMPYGAPGAYWLRLGPDVRLMHTSYGLDAAAAAVRETRYPQAAAFAADSVLGPPDEATMLAVFGSA